jgi:hypothetical protein
VYCAECAVSATGRSFLPPIPGVERDWGPALVVPVPVEVRTAVGLRMIRPTLGVLASSYLTASPLRQARIAIMAMIPDSSARARLGAWKRFGRFLALVGCALHSVSPAVVADYVVWRVAPPSGLFLDVVPVRAATAMGDLSHIRAHAYDTDAVAPDRLYGREISLVLKRLGGSEKHDSVRKTPVDVAAAERAVRRAESVDSSDNEVMLAVLLTFGLFFFLRCGECTFTYGDVSSIPDTITLTWTLQKTRSRIMPIRVSRSCSSPLLLRAWQAYLIRWPRRRDTERVLWYDSEVVSATRVQNILRTCLGPPPQLPGESRPLPWSLRAGGATLCFSKGVPTDRIMRLGRWTSEVSLMYCVLTPSVQAAAWQAVDVALAFKEAE